jgi:uncharacterized protein YjiS (DUF1127 family)
MSLTLGTKSLRHPTGFSVGTLWRIAQGAYTRMTRASRLRRELETMDSHLLADIGVSRAQLRFEIDEWERIGR